jgi:hypothetical protein
VSSDIREEDFPRITQENKAPKDRRSRQRSAWPTCKNSVDNEAVGLLVAHHLCHPRSRSASQPDLIIGIDVLPADRFLAGSVKG